MTSRPVILIASCRAASLALIFAAILGVPATADADARDDARAHYLAGEKLYASGDFRAAIAEFAKADALAPSPILEFNIALCYEKLGDDAEALRRYRLYLREMPNAPNRAGVEAKIRALEAAAAKARQPAPPPRTPAPPPEAETPAASPVAPTTPATPAEDTTAPVVAEPSPPSTAASATTLPAVDGTDQQSLVLGSVSANPHEAASAEVNPRDLSAETGYGKGPQPSDPALRRASQINVAQIRDQRLRAGFSPRVAPASSSGQVAAGPAGPSSRYAAPAQPEDSGDDDPVYTKWWFWGIGLVGAVIVYKFATADSDDESSFSTMLAPPSGPQSGPVLFRF